MTTDESDNKWVWLMFITRGGRGRWRVDRPLLFLSPLSLTQHLTTNKETKSDSYYDTITFVYTIFEECFLHFRQIKAITKVPARVGILFHHLHIM